MSENNDNSNESSSVGNDCLLQASRLSGGGSILSNSVIRAGVLRPPVLGSCRRSFASETATNSTNSFRDGDIVNNQKRSIEIVRSNPFLKEHKEETDTDDKSSTCQKTEDVDKVVKKNEKIASVSNNFEGRTDMMSLLHNNNLERTNFFAAVKNSIPIVENYGFIFGQNVHERVVGDNVKTNTSTVSENSETNSNDLFSSVIKNAAKTKLLTENLNTPDDRIETKSLIDVAREYEERRAQKRKYEEVVTFTGEENEINIIDVNCKLFAFVNSNWEERGRGSLRLNDSKSEGESSRVVFRTAGNLRLLINTKVWAGMVAARASQKSLRLTAIDNIGKVKIFLVMARPIEINKLYNALIQRINKRKISHPNELKGINIDNSDKDSSEQVSKNDLTTLEKIEIQLEDNERASINKEIVEGGDNEFDQNDSLDVSDRESLMSVSNETVS